VGQAVVLICLGFGEHGVDITWTFNGIPLRNTSLVTVYDRDITKGGGAFKQSTLQLCGVSVYSAGNYTCVVTSGLTTVDAVTQLNVQGKICAS
jgi:hypothetical protein